MSRKKKNVVKKETRKIEIPSVVLTDAITSLLGMLMAEGKDVVSNGSSNIVYTEETSPVILYGVLLSMIYHNFYMECESEEVSQGIFDEVLSDSYESLDEYKKEFHKLTAQFSHFFANEFSKHVTGMKVPNIEIFDKLLAGEDIKEKEDSDVVVSDITTASIVAMLMGHSGRA